MCFIGAGLGPFPRKLPCQPSYFQVIVFPLNDLDLVEKYNIQIKILNRVCTPFIIANLEMHCYQLVLVTSRP